MSVSSSSTSSPPPRRSLHCVADLQQRELRFADSLAAQWLSTLQLQQRSEGPSSVDPLTSQLIPVLVPALSELSRRMEQEDDLQAAHAQLRRSNPFIPPRPEFDPLTWLACYLLRHNPRHHHGHEEGSDPLTARYTAKVREALAQTEP